MLPICLGEGTKIAGLLLGGRKAYETEIALGSRTATGDREGEVIETAAVPALTRAEVEARLAAMVGPQLQTPPMYSAVHVGGKRLYELARQGLEVERPARQVEILALQLQQFATDRLTLGVVCTTGTYIRTLAEDVAKALGTVGHVARLHRQWVEPFQEVPMHTLETMEQIAASGESALAQLVLPLEQGLTGTPEVHLDAEAARRLALGQRVPASGDSGLKAVFGPGRRLLGLAELSAEGSLHARRLFTWAIDSKACVQPNAVERDPSRR
jgi:tRNA pseudouridine55 synthase